MLNLNKFNILKFFSIIVIFVLVMTPLVALGECPNDTIPANCREIIELGEDDEGCACFVCNPGAADEKVVCTDNEHDKNVLLSKPRYKKQ